MIVPKLYILRDGTPVYIREASHKDAFELNGLAARIFGSTDQVLTSLEEFSTMDSLEAQVKRISHYNQQPGKCILVASTEDQLIGTLDFWNGNRKRIAHTGEFGMGVHPDFRNRGVGKLLLEALLDWANRNPIIEKVKLAVFATNERGIHLYQKMGFVEEGRRVAEVKNGDEEYIDIIEMYKIVK